MTVAIHTDTEETRYAAIDWQLLMRFLRYAVRHRRLTLFALLLLPLAALTQFAQPILIQQAIDLYVLETSGTAAMPSAHGVGILITGLMVLVVVQFFTGYAQSVVNAAIGQRIVRDMRHDLFTHMLHMDAAFFHCNASGRLTNRLTSDTEAVSQMVGAGLINLIGDVLLLCAVAGGMVLLSPPLAAVVMLIMPLLIVLTMMIMRRLREAQRTGRVVQARMAGLLTEEIEGHTVVRLFRRQARNREEFDRLNRDYLDAALVSNHYEALQVSLVEGVSVLVVALLFWYGASLDAGDSITLGVLVAFIDYIRRLFMPIRDIAAKFTTLQAAMTAMERIFSLLDTRPALRDPEPDATHGSPKLGRGALSFHQVAFDYGKGPVLQEINLTVAAGERIAVVGPTGAGKSTLIHVLNRTYDVTAGHITIDGVDIRQLPLARLRRMIGMVQQETFLFAGSVADNIGLRDPTISPQRIRWAIEQVGADPFVSALPNGMHTTLAERGVNLSAGQRQLLGIARVFAFDPMIVVMDEATSSVDTVSETLIRNSMHRLLAHKTAIIIAHRLSTILDADRIVTMVRGRIVEQGSHDGLLARGGMYAQLFRLQFDEVRPACQEETTG
jgi:ATP-binding cassette subfamily B multidrug efflux pump